MHAEKDILRRLRAGEQMAFKHIFDEHYPMLCKVVYKMLADKAGTEDVVQELFIKLWRKREKIQITGTLATYLRGMAIKEAISYLRQRKHFEAEEKITELAMVGYEGMIEEDGLKERTESVQQAITMLPNRCRLIFRMSKIEGLTYQEIADSLGISIKTVENQMGKALKLLREKLL